MLIKPGNLIEIDYSHPLSKGLVGCWILNERTGGFLRDAIGNLNLAFAANAPRWQAPGLNFDSGVEYASGAHTPALNFGTGGFTIVTKVRWTVSANQYVVEKGYGGAAWWALNIQANSGIAFFLVADSSLIKYGATTGLNDGLWHTVSGVRNPDDTLSVFLDGLDDSAAGTVTAAGTADSATALFLGARGDLSVIRDFTGDIDFSYVYSRGLSADENAWLYAEPYAMVAQSRNIQYFDFGGTIYNVSVVDGFTGGETLSIASIFSQSVSDGISGGEVLSPETEFINSILDGVTIGDSAVSASVFNVPVVDGTLIGESLGVASVFNLSLIEGITLGEVLSGGLIFSVTATDGVIGSDTATPALTTVATATDGLSVGDLATPALTFNVTATDGTQFAEILSSIITYGVSVSDGITISDSASGAIPGGVSGMVSVTFSERGTSVTFNVRKPSITVSPRKPTINFDI